MFAGSEISYPSASLLKNKKNKEGWNTIEEMGWLLLVTVFRWFSLN
jgi:hypothetical protein